MWVNLAYRVEKVVRMRASSFSRVKGKGGCRALREVVGAGLVVLRPMPMTERNSEAL